MATITEIQERLALYKEAERTILVDGQEYRHNNRYLTRADLKEIRSQITLLESQLAAARNNGLFGHSVTVFGGRS